MDITDKIAESITLIMPVIARNVLMDFFKTIEITQPQVFLILKIYDHGEGCRLSDISKDLNIAPPTASGIVGRLEKSKYLKRKIDKNDRRAINIELTQKGIDIAKRFKAMVKKKWKRILKKMPHSDQEKLLEIMLEIKGVLE